MVRFHTADRDAFLFGIGYFTAYYVTSGHKNVRDSGLRAPGQPGVENSDEGWQARGPGQFTRSATSLSGLAGHATHFRCAPKMDTRNRCFSQPRRACRHEPQIGVCRIPLQNSSIHHGKSYDNECAFSRNAISNRTMQTCRKERNLLIHLGTIRLPTYLLRYSIHVLRRWRRLITN